MSTYGPALPRENLATAFIRKVLLKFEINQAHLEFDNDILIGLLVALAIGLLIGLERGWSKQAEKEGDRVAGIRTFGLIGLVGGVAAILSQTYNDWFLIAVFVAVTALTVAGHILDFKKNQDVGLTSAVAMLLTFSLAAWAAYGYEIQAMGVAVVVTAILGLKPVLHNWLGKLSTTEVYSGIKLLIISVVLLPLLPNEGYGPYNALNPYWIWWMVVLISGISFVGYFAIRIAGDRIGTFITAIVGAMASSTAVTISMANFAIKSVDKRLFMGGVMIASSIMFVRVMIEVAVVNVSLLVNLWAPVGAMFAVTTGAGIWLWMTSQKQEFKDEIALKNPLDLKTALKFGLLLAIILFLSKFLSDWLGDRGVLILALISGFADVDAITLSLSEMAKDETSTDVASQGIALAAASNTVVKAGIFSFYAGVRQSLGLIAILLLASILGAGMAFLL
jgi:uncharacterized membrane protein (DUF4010 family)